MTNVDGMLPQRTGLWELTRRFGLHKKKQKGSVAWRDSRGSNILEPSIKGLCESDLTDAEKKTVSRLVNAVHEIVYR